MAERDERSEAAKKELEKLHSEGGLFASEGLKSTAKSVKGHFRADDADQSDPMEIWGTRIGRGLAVIAFLALVIYLFNYLQH